MTTAYLVSTALMGMFVLAVLGWIGRSRGWYHYSPSTERVPLPPGDGLNERFNRLSGDPIALTVAFALLVVGAVGSVALYIGGPPEMRAAAGIAVALGGGLLLVGYLLFGIYLSATRRGHPRSLAVAESATVAGALFLVAVTLQLVG